MPLFPGGASSTTGGLITLDGDLGGTAVLPSVIAINGTTVPASPSAGQVLTATSSTTALWENPTAGTVTPTGDIYDGYYLQLRGVNFQSGIIAYTSLPAVSGSNYLFPAAADINYIAGKGANFCRITYGWEALQPTLGGSISNTYNTNMQTAVNAALAAGMYVMIEMHPYNSSVSVSYTYNNVAIGTSPVTYAQFANLFTQLATQYTNEKVIFGICNEPNGISSSTWLSATQAAINAIRAAGNNNMIFVQPVNYGSVLGFFSNNYFDGSSAPSVGMLQLTDPANNLVLSLHHYFDSSDGYSGGATDIASATFPVTALQPLVAWCQTNNYKVHLSEFAADSTNPIAPNALNNLYNYMGSNAQYIIGGSWWGYTSVGFGAALFDLQPTTPYTVDDPDMGLFKPFVATGLDGYTGNWVVNSISGGIGGVVPITNPISFGKTPALSGEIRLGNTNSITSRNAAGTADLSIIYIDASNNLQVGNTTSPTYIPSLSTVGLAHVTTTTGLLASSLLVNADVSTTAAIAVSKLAAGTSTQVLLNNATPTPTWTTLAGDMTVGATGTTTVAKVNGTSVPASPAANTVLLATSTTAASWSAAVPVIITNLHTSTAAIANTLTQVIGATIAANAMSVGTTYVIRAYGYMTNTTATGTAVWSIRINPATLGTNIHASQSYTTSATAHTSVAVEIEAIVTIRTTGSSGTALGSINVIGGATLGATVPSVTVTSAQAVNTTVSNVVEFDFISGASTTTMTITNATIEQFTL